MELLVVGHLSRDLIVTPELTREALGGGTAYAMLAPALGVMEAGIVSRVGEDFEKEYRDTLRTSGLDITGLRTGGHRSTRFVNRYDEQGGRTQEIEAIAPQIRAEDFMPQHMRADIVHFCPLTAEEIHPACFELARLNGSLVSLDIQGFLREPKIGPVRGREWTERHEILRYVDILKADDVEVLACCGTNSEVSAVSEIMRYGPRIVVVTRDSRGSTIYTRNAVHSIPAVLPSRMVDETGCGDTYILGFVIEYARCGDVKRAGLFAATCASFNLETVGPYDMPSRQEVEERMRKYT